MIKKASSLLIALCLNANAYEEVPSNIPTWLYCQANDSDISHHSEKEVYVSFLRKQAWKVYDDSWQNLMVNGHDDVRYTSSNYRTVEGQSSHNLNARRNDTYYRLEVKDHLQTMQLTEVTIDNGLILGDPYVLDYYCRAVMKPTTSIKNQSDAAVEALENGDISPGQDAIMPQK